MRTRQNHDGPAGGGMLAALYRPGPWRAAVMRDTDGSLLRAIMSDTHYLCTARVRARGRYAIT